MAQDYESDALLAQYFLLHYGTPGQVLPYEEGPRTALDFPARCVMECVDTSAVGESARALDLGCAVGRSSFELSRLAGEVIGIDASRRFIGAANGMKLEGSAEFEAAAEGDITEPMKVSLPPGVHPDRVSFEVGDACDLRDDLGSFDLLLMANLIDRLPDPRACLDRLPTLVNPGGQLIITSPYTWMTMYTPKDRWLCGEERSTRETLEEILRPAFTLAEVKDMPFLIREHARKFQWTVAEATLWRRR